MKKLLMIVGVGLLTGFGAFSLVDHNDPLQEVLDGQCTCDWQQPPECPYGTQVNWACYDAACVAYTEECADALDKFYNCIQNATTEACQLRLRADIVIAKTNMTIAIAQCCEPQGD